MPLAGLFQLLLALGSRAAGIDRNQQQRRDGRSRQGRPLPLAEPHEEQSQGQGTRRESDAPFQSEGVEAHGERHTEHHARQETGHADIGRALPPGEGLGEAEQEAENQTAPLADAAKKQDGGRHTDKALLPALGDVEDAVEQQGDGHAHQKTRQGAKAVEGETLEEAAKASTEAGERPAALDKQRHDHRVEERGDEDLSEDAADGTDRPAVEAALRESEEIGP